MTRSGLELPTCGILMCFTIGEILGDTEAGDLRLRGEDSDDRRESVSAPAAAPASLASSLLSTGSIAAAPTNNRSSGRPVPDTGMLQATLRPSAMNELGLLHSGWPSPVRSSRKLDLVVRSLKGAAISLEDWRWMDGQLLLP